MAHKGRIYPIDQRLRIYNAFVAWPFFLAKTYQMKPLVWDGTLAPFPASGLTIDAPRFSIDDATRTVQYRGIYPYVGPEVIELGIVWSIFNALGTSNRCFCNVWVDGVAQYEWHTNDSEQIAHCEAFEKTAASGKLAGAVLWLAGKLTATAKPW